MTKKELYYIALEAASASLSGYFRLGSGDHSFDTKYFQKPLNKPIAKSVYDVLAKHFLEDEKQLS
jgi:hypothetical protein